MRVIRNKSVVHVLFTQIAEQMEQREGGYTRIVKIAPRKGDSTPAAIIELVTEPVSPKKAVVKEAEAATKVAAATELRSRRPPPLKLRLSARRDRCRGDRRQGRVRPVS